MSSSRIGRRDFIKIGIGGLALLVPGIHPTAAEPFYRVGVGKSADPYHATQRAIAASGEWPSTRILGKTVVIKPNLVSPMPADTGVTTDPEVVRALVDVALESGAADVLIIENGIYGANFSACGYDFFSTYDSRVSLIDLDHESSLLVKVPEGLSYSMIYMPELLLYDDVVFISAAKLKTHYNTHATLTMKNLIGLPPYQKYRISPSIRSVAIHYRGINQAIVDLNLIRPIDYAVVDGIWGLEGNGPSMGEPVNMGMVIAGKNAVAVDRVCLEVTAIPQNGVMHLTYASHKGLGPYNLNDIDISGDTFIQKPFKRPSGLPPLLEYPRVFPKKFTPRTGQNVRIVCCHYPFPCFRRIDIIRTTDLSPEVIHIRTLQDWTLQPAGLGAISWNGRDDSGAIVSPGLYCVRIGAKYNEAGHNVFASGWVLVV
jgi:uncharacterized protein (DUF362 family)